MVCKIHVTTAVIKMFFFFVFFYLFFKFCVFYSDIVIIAFDVVSVVFISIVYIAMRDLLVL